MIVNIFEFSLFPKNGLKWLLLVQIGSLLVQNNIYNIKFLKIVQNNIGQIIWYLNIFEYLDKYIHLQKYSLIFLGRIYLDIHLWSFYHAEYIRIFICPISIVTNIFGYSFIQQKDIRPTLVLSDLGRIWN